MDSVNENKKKKKHECGQSIIELSLITPLILIALYIPADFGVAFFVGNLTQTAAREGARIGSGLQKSVTGKTLIFSSSEANMVKTEVLDRLPAFLKDKTVTVKFYSGTACMEFIEVTAEGEYNFFLYQLTRWFGGPVSNSVTISRTTQMHHKYQPYTNDAYCTSATTYGPYSA